MHSDLDAMSAWVDEVQLDIRPDADRHPIRARVQVRYRHTGVPATLNPEEGGRVRVEFDEPVRAVAPGQAAVFYDLESENDTRGEIVIGGGWLSGRGAS